MKKLCVLLLLVLMGLMLQPVGSQVNTQPSKIPLSDFRTDGGPKPPVPPSCCSLAAPVRPGISGTVFVADGPKPPLPPGCCSIMALGRPSAIKAMPA